MSSIKPYLFCDVDGVLNALMYYKIWVGPELPPDTPWWDPMMTDRKNWGVERYKEDLKKEFLIDREACTTLPAKQNGWGDITEEKKLILHWSSEVINTLRDLINSGKVDFYWLTTWRDDAVNLLNPLFDFPESTPFLQWQNRGMSDYNQSGKGSAIYDLFRDKEVWEDNKPYPTRRLLTDEEAAEVRKPFIWLDDVATSGSVNFPPSQYRRQNHIQKTFKTKNLTIKTKPRSGINRKELAAIIRFAEECNK